MTDAQPVLRSLQSVGMQWFVACFQAHQALADGRIPQDKWEQALDAAGCSPNPAGRGRRRSAVMRIFQAGRETDALQLIADSRRTKPWVVQAARRLLATRNPR